ncbi:MAG: T9SS type A sorting domain-containing protein [Bacteroidota bacterium]|nr:T9SS type A sorting domain-containing protein [Bacteroidota bacterium]
MCRNFTHALLFVLTSFPALLKAQPPVVGWNKLLGSNQDESTLSMIATSDGNYVFVGSTPGSQNGDISASGHGGKDYWLVKVDPAGNKIWDRLFGGGADDEPSEVIQTADGGYAIAGYSKSSQSGDVTGTLHGTNGYSDLWVVKTDASGNLQWQTLLGGADVDAFYGSGIRQLSDGGFIIATSSSQNLDGSSPNGDVTDTYHGQTDGWLVRLDATGQKLWDNLLGGINGDFFNGIELLGDGNFLVTGNTNSFHTADGDITNFAHGIGLIPKPDALVMKVDQSGNRIWDKEYGSFGFEGSPNLRLTNDGGFIFGVSTSAGYVFGAGDITDPFYSTSGDADEWVVKADADGNIQWNRLLGGSSSDGGQSSLWQEADGGYIVATSSFSSLNGAVSDTTHGLSDLWLVKLNPAGTKQWDKLFGGSQNESSGTLLPLASGAGYIWSGISNSSQSGDITAASHGGYDVLLLRLVPDAAGGALPLTFLSFTAIAKSNIVWLEWKTANEINTKDFVVQRSADGNSWFDIGTVEAGGQNAAVLRYSYADNAPAAGQNYYRLLQRDKDGQFSYSKIQSITVNGQGTDFRVLVNPVNGKTLELQTSVASIARIYNLQGIVLKQVQLSGGRNTIDVSGLAAGSYSISTGNQVQQFIVR